MASPNIWAQMGYVPPRGQCNHKESILSAKCSCLRFMIHPMKATTSFDCDGCAHHASFHTMENPQETEIIKRWALADQDTSSTTSTSEATTITTTGGPSRKRPRRAIESGTTASFVEELTASSTRKTVAAAGGRKKREARTSRVAGVIEVDEELEEVGSGIIGGFFTRR